jgi:hypothetical protein
MPATYYQLDLTGGPNQVYLSGLPDSEWLALADKSFSGDGHPITFHNLRGVYVPHYFGQGTH